MYYLTPIVFWLTIFTHENILAVYLWIKFLKTFNFLMKTIF